MAKLSHEFSKLLVKGIDLFIPKNPNLWVIPVCHKRYVLYDNPRFLFEYAKLNPQLTIKVLVHDVSLPEHKEYSEYIEDIYSVKALTLLLRAGVLIIRHSLKDAYWEGFSNDKRKIINLWHGIPLKKIRFFSGTFTESRRRRESDNTTAIISSSVIDKLAMSAAHQIPPNDVWTTGLPRNDIFSPNFKMTPSLKREEEKLLNLLEGKKLILYAPTFREVGSGSYPFTEKELETLQKFCTENGYVFGTRLHTRDLGQIGSGTINLGQNIISESQIVLKHTAILITDYSSMWVDYLLMDRPVIGFCFDYDKYVSEDRGFIYHYEDVFPGAICKDFYSIMNSLREVADGKDQEDSQKRKHAIKMFHEYSNDGLCSKRVYDRIMNL